MDKRRQRQPPCDTDDFINLIRKSSYPPLFKWLRFVMFGWLQMNNYTTISKTSFPKIIEQMVENRSFLLLVCLSILLPWLSHFICSDFSNTWILIIPSSKWNFIHSLSERRKHIHCVGTCKWAAYNPSQRDQDKPRRIFICRLQYVLCSISPNSSRWHKTLVRGTPHSETHTSLWQSLCCHFTL